MSNELLLDAEKKLDADHDGSYKNQLIGLLEDFQNQYASAKQGFLAPDEYEKLDHLDNALGAALTVIKEYQSETLDPMQGATAESVFMA